MYALSLWDPWATLWVHGQKKVETRSWKPSFAPPFVLAVHAAHAWHKEANALSRREPFRSALERCGCKFERDGKKEHLVGLRRGCVIGFVRVSLVLPSEEARERLLARHDQQELAFGDYTPGRWCWFTDERFVLPIGDLCGGRRLLFPWKPTILQEWPDWVAAELAKEAA